MPPHSVVGYLVRMHPSARSPARPTFPPAPSVPRSLGRILCTSAAIRYHEGTFAARYCAARNLSIDAYVETVLYECLYPHARWLLGVLPRDFFAIDREFVASVGRLCDLRKFGEKYLEFTEEPAARHWARRRFRLRLSAGRLKSALAATFGESGAERSA